MPVDGALVELVEDELRAASDRGELMSRAQLREAVGIGHGDLEQALDALRDAGKATEVEPDGYRMVLEEDLRGEPVAEREAASAPAEPERSSPARRERVAAIGQGAGRVEFAGEATVTMPRAMVNALDAPTLGALLLAGIEASDGGEAFVFEVTP